jgi:hypothetical protein
MHFHHSDSSNAKHSALTNEGMDELFQRVARGEYIAFETIFKKTYQNLCFYSNRFVMSPQLAEEIVDDVFFNLWNNREKIQISLPGHLRSQPIAGLSEKIKTRKEAFSPGARGIPPL